MTDDLTDEMYLPLTSMVVLKCKQEMLYVPLDFKNNLTIDVLVYSRAYISAITGKELATIKQQASKNIPEFDDPSIFQHKKQMAT